MSPKRFRRRITVPWKAARKSSEEVDLQTKSPKLTPDANGRLTGLVYTQDETLAHAIEDDVGPICRIETVTASVPGGIENG